MNRTICRAFSPAHISLAFLPQIERDPLKSGSMGFGIALSEGVTAEVEVSRGGALYTVNSREGDRDFVEGFLKRIERRLQTENVSIKEVFDDLKISMNISFPLSQGFGMSASSLLSIALGLFPILTGEGSFPRGSKVDSLKTQEMMREEFFSSKKREGISGIFRALVESAHEYEVEMRWGLGDVVGALRGGVAIRTRPGVPPHGEVVKSYLTEEGLLYIAVVGKEIPTPEVLMDPELPKRIKGPFKRAMRILKNGSDPSNLFAAGEAFGRGSHIAPEDVLQATERLKENGFPSSPVMIGNTLCSYVPKDKIERSYQELEGTLESPTTSWENAVIEDMRRRLDSILRDFPINFSRVCKVDYMGARIMFSKEN